MGEKIKFSKFRGWLHLLPVIFGAISAAVYFLVGFQEKSTHFEELALGEATKSYHASVEGGLIHCKDLNDAELCLDAFQERGTGTAALWLGNSQLHAVNQLQPGQENSPPILFRLLHKKNIDLITFSQPNASIQEHYVLFEYLRSRLPISLLILPVVFDDLREAGIRSEISSAFQDKNTVTALQRTAIGRAILDQFNKKSQLAVSDKGTVTTLQERSEAAISGWLGKKSRLWSLRPEIRGQFLITLYLIRNTVFGIKATSKRHVIPGRYQANIAALEAIVDSAKAANVRVLLYIVPLRDDGEIPYEQKEYQGFKGEMMVLAKNKKIAYKDLEHLVPSQYWGAKASTSMKEELEIDFMHFQAQGHKLLADSLYQVLEEQIFKGRP